MTPEEMFEAWWRNQPVMRWSRHNAAEAAWLASRETTAKKAVEIFRGRMYASDAADDIEREFGL